MIKETKQAADRNEDGKLILNNNKSNTLEDCGELAPVSS